MGSRLWCRSTGGGIFLYVLSNSFQLMLFRIVDAVFFTCGAMIIASVALISSGSTAKRTGAVRGIGTEICKPEKCETENHERKEKQSEEEPNHTEDDQTDADYSIGTHFADVGIGYLLIRRGIQR